MKTGHCCNKVLGSALDNGCYSNTNLTSRNLMNVDEMFGLCEVCSDPHEPLSKKEHDTRVGSTLYLDLVPLAETSLGGKNWALVAVEGTSLFMMVELLKTKSENDVCKALN